MGKKQVIGIEQRHSGPLMANGVQTEVTVRSWIEEGAAITGEPLAESVTITITQPGFYVTLHLDPTEAQIIAGMLETAASDDGVTF